MKFWVQIYGLPVSMLDTEMAIELGETLGSVSSVEYMKDMLGETSYELEWKLMCQNHYSEVTEWLLTPLLNLDLVQI